MKEIKRTVSNEAALGKLAETLAQVASQGDVLLLNGDLGAGKTSFARAFIRARGYAKIEVISPSFLLVQEYPDAQNGMIYHYDLYRLKSADELWELGIEEMLGSALVLVEWPDMVEVQWPDDRLEIEISAVKGNAQARSVVVRAHGSMVGKLEQARLK